MCYPSEINKHFQDIKMASNVGTPKNITMNDSGLPAMLESTPNHNQLRKKFTFKKHLYRGFPNYLEPSPIPITSSTLNESVLGGNDLMNLKITPDVTQSSSGITSPTEFYRNHQKIWQKTPVKLSSTSKLGSPERNELISGRKPTPMKGVTPRLAKSSPAKKRLFGIDRCSTVIKKDPVHFFTKQRNLSMVVGKIFGGLNGCDLHNCRKVNQLWRKTVDSFPDFNKAAVEFATAVEREKENPRNVSKLIDADKSINNNCTANKSHGNKSIYDRQSLNENQSITKCTQCMHPTQVMEFNIGQCLNCGYISCNKCFSFAYSPENFVDRCNSSALLTSSRGSLQRTRTLMDSPPSSQLFSSLSASSPHNRDFSDFTSFSRDSCYFSYEDIPMSSSRLEDDDKDKSLRAFRDTNGRSAKRLSDENSILESQKIKRQAKRYAPVVRIKKSPEKKPWQSPEKDLEKSRGVGTAQSKKRLRRLAL